MKQYTFMDEPRGAQYRALLAYSPRLCSEAQLVVRDGIDLSPNAASILKRLEPWLLEQQRVSEWSGTKLHGGTAALYRYRLCPDTVSLLSCSVGGLYEWVQPERPEDIALLFADGTPWLTTIAHERDAYLTMSIDQAAPFFDECLELSQRLSEPMDLPSPG